MPKQQLTGALDEQLATVYDMVEERMSQGKYSGAVHYAKEIVKVDPHYRDIQDILGRAQRAKREQSLTLTASLAGAVIVIAITRWLGLTEDWQSLFFAFIGLVFGFVIATWLFIRRREAESNK